MYIIYGWTCKGRKYLHKNLKSYFFFVQKHSSFSHHISMTPIPRNEPYLIWGCLPSLSVNCFSSESRHRAAGRSHPSCTVHCYWWWQEWTLIGEHATVGRVTRYKQIQLGLCSWHQRNNNSTVTVVGGWSVGLKKEETKLGIK